MDGAGARGPSQARGGDVWLVAASLPLLLFLAIPIVALLLRTPLGDLGRTLRYPVALQAMR